MLAIYVALLHGVLCILLFYFSRDNLNCVKYYISDCVCVDFT